MAKVGRNEPCPCGSGKKFKKCCIGTIAPPSPPPPPGPKLDFDFAPSPAGMAGGSSISDRVPYATEDFLRAQPDSPVSHMELLAREADSEEERGNPTKAFEILTRVLAMAPDDDMRRTVLQDLEALAMNDAELRERGPDLSRELEKLNLKMGDHGQAAQSAAERADFLNRLGQGEEAVAEYTRALSAYPKSSWLRIRHARFLADQGNRESAEASYREAMALPDDHHSRQVAEEELRDL